MAEDGMLPFAAASKLLAEGLSKLCDDESMTDFVIKCQDSKWQVHRVVLALQSPVLAAACTQDFKESKQRELDLSAEDPVCIDTLIVYLYHLNYDERSLAKSDYAMPLHVQMCILADKYNMPALQALAVEKFKKHADRKEVTEREFAQAATIAYEAQDPAEEICRHVVMAVVERKLFVQDSDMGAEFEQVMRTYQNLATDIAKAQCAALESRARKGEKRLQCPSCQNTFIRGFDVNNVNEILPAVGARLVSQGTSGVTTLCKRNEEGLSPWFCCCSDVGPGSDAHKKASCLREETKEALVPGWIKT